MNARKLLSILLALLIALAILPIAAGAAGDPFCTVDTASYDDLAAAAQAASSSGQPILITKDFDCAGQLELDGLDVAVELQGFTLNVTRANGTGAAGAGLYVHNGGALTVNGPGSLNFRGPFAGIYVGSAAAGDYGVVTITGGAALHGAGSYGVVSNNSLNEVQITGALGGHTANTYCVYCVDGKLEVFGSLDSPENGPPIRNNVYADNNAEVYVYGNVSGADANISCPAAAAARIWILGFSPTPGVTDGAGYDIKIGGARAEGYSTSFTYPGYTERYRIQKYSGANAIGMDPGYPLGYIFESRVWVKIPTPITPEPITGVISPAAGAVPSRAIGSGTEFTAEISWSPSPPVFDANTAHTAIIKLTAKPGYIFRDMNTDAAIAGFTVNGIEPTLLNYAGYSDRVGIEISVTFPATGEFPVITPGPITGVTSPVLGASPSKAIDDGANYTALILGWSPNPHVFDAITVYTARIQLTANPGYGFSGLDTDALIEGFTVNGIKPKFENRYDKPFNRLELSITFPATDDFPRVAPEPITGVTSPVAAAYSSIAIDDGTNYSAVIFGWSPGPVKFDENTTYTVRIQLAANPGYVFRGMNSDAAIEGFTVNGIKPNFESLDDRAERLVFTVTFPATGELPRITPGPITGVTPPVAGAVPSMVIDNGTNFTAQLLSWSQHPPYFNANTVYTATIQLTANPGFYCDGLNTDALIEGFTVNGIKPKFENNWSDRLVFTVAFPATGDFTRITPEPITGVISPAAGFRAANAINNGTSFNAEILGWWPGWPFPASFDTGREYSVTIHLTAKPGYTFSGLNTDAAIEGFTVNGIKPKFVDMNDSSDQLIITITFPETERKFIRLWGKTTRYEDGFWTWMLCIFIFGWIWMWF